MVAKESEFSKSLSIHAVIVQKTNDKNCDFHNNTLMVKLVPDAESFGLLDAKEGGFYLWLAVFLV